MPPSKPRSWDDLLSVSRHQQDQQDEQQEEEDRENRYEFRARSSESLVSATPSCFSCDCLLQETNSLTRGCVFARSTDSLLVQNNKSKLGRTSSSCLGSGSATTADEVTHL